MKKIILGIFSLICLQSFSQTQSWKIVNANTSIEYLKRERAGALVAIRTARVEVEYWSSADTGNIDQNIVFVMASRATAASSNPVIQMAAAVISAGDFSTTHKTVSIDIPIAINAVNTYTPEFFSIGLDSNLTGAAKSPFTGGLLGINIDSKSSNEPTRVTPEGFSFINAVNFDFDGNTGAGYVGNLNIFKPCGLYTGRYLKLGYNLGIMKINYSKNDSLNDSYSYAENALIRPLDNVSLGTKYLRQYNKLSNVSKNLTWSFYFQPTVAIYYRKNVKLLAHIHTELFINKWTTNTSISNYQQDTGIFNNTNIAILKDSINMLNKFANSTKDIITSTSTSTVLNFNLGAGITLESTLWDDGFLFVQATVGWAFNYDRPTSINNKSLSYNPTERENIFAHLTRFRVSQKLTTNIQAVIGIDVRGRFTRTPTYAAFVGINIGLDGIRNLLK